MVLHRCCMFVLFISAVIVMTIATNDGGAIRSRRSANCSSSGCNGGDREQLALVRVEQIKRELLDKLGLADAPRVSPGALPPLGRNNPTVVRLLSDAGRNQKHNHYQHHMMSDEPAPDDPPARAEKTYVFGRTVPPQFGIAAPTAYFEFSTATMSKHIVDAHLQVPLRPLPNDNSKVDVKLQVLERMQNGSEGRIISEIKHLHHRLSHERYVSVPIDVRDLRLMFDGDRDNDDDSSMNNNFIDDEKRQKTRLFGLYVKAMARTNTNLAVHPQDSVDESNTMYLELTTMEKATSRHRRNTDHVCPADGADKICCLYDLQIDFEAAGWDFVIAPKRYNAYMCNGECRHNQLISSPHAKIANEHQQAQLRNGDTNGSGGVTVGSCCHPTEYDPITLIYMTNDREVLISKVNGMIARRCGCA